MKQDLLDRLVCPDCGQDQLESMDRSLRCRSCGSEFPVEEGIPIFSTVPADYVPFQPFQRGPDLGTRWRQANWQFLEKAVSRLPADAVILDVGAGRGDFAAIFKGCRYLSLDLYPYPEVDLVADLTRNVPLQAGCLDTVMLANVLEHVQNPAALLAAISRLLKPGGVVLATIPFLLKIHQAPYDFTRWTRYGLEELGSVSGLQVESLEGYYDPVFLLTEARQNLERFGLKGRLRTQRGLGRAALAAIRILEKLLGFAAGLGKAGNPADEESPAPLGYHVMYRKPAASEGVSQ
jgi:SAM-dependent methyltransferase